MRKRFNFHLQRKLFFQKVSGFTPSRNCPWYFLTTTYNENEVKVKTSFTYFKIYTLAIGFKIYTS